MFDFCKVLSFMHSNTQDIFQRYFPDLNTCNQWKDIRIPKKLGLALRYSFSSVCSLFLSALFVQYYREEREIQPDVGRGEPSCWNFLLNCLHIFSVKTPGPQNRNLEGGIGSSKTVQNYYLGHWEKNSPVSGLG